MNLYFLLEGKRTEPRIYPKWFEFLLPSYARIKDPYSVESNQYYMISGMGFPSLLHNHLKNSIDEVNEIDKYDYLVIVLDSEEENVEFRINEVNKFIENNNLELNCRLKIIVQHRCIETWLLGNKKVFARQPSSTVLVKYIQHYNVYENDPENCHKYEIFSTTADFHLSYLKLMLKERNISYTKKYPRDTAEVYYLEQLINRTKNGHIKSFKDLMNFCEKIEK